MLSIHDNYLQSYEVDCKGARIVLHTLDTDPSTAALHTDVIFTDVIGYYFQYDLLKHSNIIFSVDPIEIDYFVTDEWEELIQGEKRGWPAMLRFQTKAELAELLREKGVTVFYLYSSLGLDGFVLAKEMQIVDAGSIEASPSANK